MSTTARAVRAAVRTFAAALVVVGLASAAQQPVAAVLVGALLLAVAVGVALRQTRGAAS